MSEAIAAKSAQMITGLKDVTVEIDKLVDQRRVVREILELSETGMNTCPVISAFVCALNDGMDDAQRQRLIPFLTRLIDTKSLPSVEADRAYIAVNFAVTEAAPIGFLTAGNYDNAADVFRAFAPIATVSDARNAAWNLKRYRGGSIVSMAILHAESAALALADTPIAITKVATDSARSGLSAVENWSSRGVRAQDRAKERRDWRVNNRDYGPRTAEQQEAERLNADLSLAWAVAIDDPLGDALACLDRMLDANGDEGARDG